MNQVIAILLFAAVWICSGGLLALHERPLINCKHPHLCPQCLHYERRWHKRAWIMDGVIAFIAVPFLFWLFK